MTPKAIPLIRAAGSHAEVGAQIGAATADAVRRAVGEPFDAGVVAAYRAVTLEHLPWIVEELEAVGEAAGVDPLAVFAASIEELQPAEEPVRCTDLLLTREGRVLVGHNNDLYAREEQDVVAIEWRVPGEPVVFTLGTGPWISVGWNDAGVSVTGNEVAPNDEQVGIPRLLQVRDVLTRRTLDDAVEAILHPARASSYNWVLADASGRALNVEGSAKSARSWGPSEKATLAHTNHYVHEEMLALERTSTDGSRSLGRPHMSNAAPPVGPSRRACVPPAQGIDPPLDHGTLRWKSRKSTLCLWNTSAVRRPQRVGCEERGSPRRYAWTPSSEIRSRR